MFQLTLVKNPEFFFSELVDTAIKNQQVQLSDHAKIYIINLLSRNIKSNDAPYLDVPLSIIFQQSFIEPLRQRRPMLKYVGDYSLYIGGYFSESLNRKIIDVGYYLSVGAQAFSNLSNIAESSQNSSLYSEIFKKFSNLMDILTEVSFETHISRAEDLIRLYDRWLKTGSSILERKLIEKGIITSDKKLRTT
ncbi:MAG: hypothetical protein WCQ53_00910 [bacterium]